MSGGRLQLIAGPSWLGCRSGWIGIPRHPKVVLVELRGELPAALPPRFLAQLLLSSKRRLGFAKHRKGRDIDVASLATPLRDCRGVLVLQLLLHGLMLV